MTGYKIKTSCPHPKPLIKAMQPKSGFFLYSLHCSVYTFSVPYECRIRFICIAGKYNAVLYCTDYVHISSEIVDLNYLMRHKYRWCVCVCML